MNNKKFNITLPEHLISPLGYSGVPVTQSLVFCVVT